MGRYLIEERSEEKIEFSFERKGKISKLVKEIKGIIGEYSIYNSKKKESIIQSIIQVTIIYLVAFKILIEIGCSLI